MAHSIPQPTLYRVMNNIMRVVGTWIVGMQLRRDVGQLFVKRLCDVQEMWVRYEAGTLRRRAPRVAEAAVPGVAAVGEAVHEAVVADAPVVLKRVRAVGERLPFKFGWLQAHMKWDATPCKVQLEALLEQPEFGAFLEEFPHVARKLRPICRAFAVDTVFLRLPRKIRVVKPRKPRVRKPSYVDIQYRCGPDLDGRHWVLRLSRSGLRYKRL